MTNVRSAVLVLLTAAAIGLSACATLTKIVQPPTFELARSHASQIRLVGPTFGRPLGGAQVRLWTRVQNPNAVGIVLTRLDGDIRIGDQHAADVDLPLGLPLPAAGDTVIPLDVSISFADIPDLADEIASALTGQPVAYALRGTVTVDAGLFGQPTFGPLTFLQGDLPVVR